MSRQFATLCGVAIDFGFTNIYFATNGMLLTADKVASLPRGARYTFTIDFASDAPYFEEVRGTPGSWVRIRDNIQNILRDEKLSNFSVEIQDISTYRPDKAGNIDENFRSLVSIFDDRYKRLMVFRKTFHNATGLVRKYGESPGKRKYHLCPYPWTSLNIASNGDVVACCRDLRRQTVLGNLLVQTLPEIWRGKPFQELRRNLVEHHPERSLVCQGCDLPYDSSKFSLRNLVRTAIGRLQVFD